MGNTTYLYLFRIILVLCLFKYKLCIMKTVSRISIFSLFTLFVINAFGQEIKISRDIGIRNEFQYEIFPNLGNNTILYRDRGQQYFFDIFDKNLLFQRTANLTFEEKRTSVIRVIKKDSVLCSIYNFISKDTMYFAMRTYSSEATLIKRDTLLAIFKDEISESELRSIISEDNTKIALFNIVKSKLYNIVIDLAQAKPKIIINSFLQLDKVGSREEFRHFKISNSGEIFLLFEKSSSFFSEGRHAYNLLSTADGLTYDQHVISAKGLKTSRVKMEYNEVNGHIVIAGLFGYKSEFDCNGIFYINENPKNLHLISDIFIMDFDDDLAKELYGKKIGNGKTIRDHLLKNIHFRSDGGFILISEMEKEFVRRNTAGGIPAFGSNFPSLNMRGLVDLYHEDLVVFSFNQNNQLDWRKILFKKQFSQDDDGVFSSFFLFSTPSRLHIIYNDEIKNNNTVSDYILDYTGKFERNSVLNTDYQGLRLRFKDAIQTGSNRFIVPSERNYKLALVEVVF